LDVVRKVNRRRSDRQLDRLPGRGKYVDLVSKDIALHQIDERLSVLVAWGGQHGLEPLDPVLERLVGLPPALLVLPVSGDAKLGQLVHLLCADLDL
jgi:hypothetical protein